MNRHADDPRFRPSEETRRRWGTEQRVIWKLAAAGGALFVLLIATSRDSTVVLAVSLVAVALLYACVGAYYFYRRSKATLPEGATWAGAGSLQISAIRAAGVTQELRVKSERRLRFWTRGVCAVAARLEVRPEGLCWSLGFLARLLGVRGRVRVPWSRIKDIEIGDAPGTIRQLGGGIAVFLDDGGGSTGSFSDRATNSWRRSRTRRSATVRDPDL